MRYIVVTRQTALTTPNAYLPHILNWFNIPQNQATIIAFSIGFLTTRNKEKRWLLSEGRWIDVIRGLELGPPAYQWDQFRPLEIFLFLSSSFLYLIISFPPFLLFRCSFWFAFILFSIDCIKIYRNNVQDSVATYRRFRPKIHTIPPIIFTNNIQHDST